MSKLTAQETAYQWLTDRIRAVPPDEGTFLLEIEVAEGANVSRTPVREAMTRLQAEGLVQRTPRKGIFVPPISEAEISWLAESRELIELHAFASVLGDAETVEAMRLALRRQEEASDRAVFIEADHDFHNASVTAAGNVFQIASYKLLEERQLRLGCGALALREDRRDDVLREHHAILDAFAAEDMPALRDAVAAHLESTRDRLRSRRSSTSRASRTRFAQL